jgi:hypothetical protein
MAVANDNDVGRDTSCTDSLKTGRFVTGARLLAEAAYRRITTPRGSLRGGEDEANYGIDITGICGSTNAASVAASLPGRIRSELEKDERFGAIDVEVLYVMVGATARFTITIDVETAAGPFTLSLLASQVSVELLGIAA